MVKVMNEEEIRCCINIATLDRKLPYKKLLKEMKKEHLVDVCYELLKEHLALLDIKEYIETECSNKYCTNSRLYITDGLKKDLIFKINKALGSDSNE